MSRLLLRRPAPTRARVAAPHDPFRGLEPFDEADEPFFFGRRAESDILVANLRASRLTLVFGPSGAGKTSLLRAGVARKLRDQAHRDLELRGRPRWAVAVFRGPWDDPFAGLRAEIMRAVEELLGPEAVADPPAAESPVERLRQWTERIGGDLLIILDQFEDYFVHQTPRDDGVLAKALGDAIADRSLPVHFLVSMRDDAIARLDRLSTWVPKLFSNRVEVERLDREGATAAIRGPIGIYDDRHAGPAVEIEAPLVDAVLDGVEAHQGPADPVAAEDEGTAADAPAREQRFEAPFLQLVMKRVWDEEVAAAHRGDGTIRLRAATLERLGGPRKVVEDYFRSAVGRLGWRERTAAARAFRCLVTSSGAKVAYSESDLAVEVGRARRRLPAVLRKLDDARLLHTVAPSPRDPSQPRYEIHHDVLAGVTRDWASDHLVRRRYLVWGGAGAAVVLALGGLAGWGFANANEAAQERDTAQANELGSRSLAELAASPEESLRDASRAIGERDTPLSREALHGALAVSLERVVMRGHKDSVSDAEFSPDGERVLTAGGNDNRALLWDSETGTILRSFPHRGWVNTATFGSRGRRVLTASDDGTAVIWDAASGHPLHRLRFPSGVKVTWAGFSPARSGSRYVLAISDKDTASVWDARSGKRLRQLRLPASWTNVDFGPDGRGLIISAGPAVRIVDWRDPSAAPSFSPRVEHDVFATPSPAGRLLLVLGGNRDLELWRLGRRARYLRSLPLSAGFVEGAQFSRDGRRIVAWAGKRAYVYSTSSGRQLAELVGQFGGSLVSATLSPRGDRVVTATRDGDARVWDVVSGSMIADLSGHRATLKDAELSPDGRRVVTASSDGTARVWAVPAVASLGRSQPAWITALAVDPHGAVAATGGKDGRVTVWRTRSWTRAARPRYVSSPVQSLAFTPGGDSLAIIPSMSDKPAMLWRWGTGRPRPLPGPAWGKANTVEFRSDGRLMVTADGDGWARVRRVRDGAVVRRLWHPLMGVNDAAFSPANPGLVATAAVDGLRLFDWRTRRRLALARLPGQPPLGDVLSVSFSDDGRSLVTGGSDGTAHIWDMGHRREAIVLAGHTGPVTSAEFTPGGRRIVTASLDGTTRVWDRESGDQLALFRVHRDAVNGAAVVPGSSGRWSILSVSDDRTAMRYACPTCDLSTDAALREAKERLARLDGAP